MTRTSKRPSRACRRTCSRLKSSSRPGKTISSSLLTSATSAQRRTPASQRCTAPQLRSASRRLSTSCPHRWSATSTGSGPSGWSSESARLWAASVLSTSVRRPSAASRPAVAAATLVLPTPPLPVYTRMRMSPPCNYYEIEVLGRKKLLFDGDTPEGGAGGRLLARHLEGCPHLGHEGQELGLLLLGQRPRHPPHEPFDLLAELARGRLALLGEPHNHPAAVLRLAVPVDQATPGQPLADARGGAERGAEDLSQFGHGPLAVALEQHQGQHLRARQLAVQGQHVGVEQGRAQAACEDQVQQSVHLPPNITEPKYPSPILLRCRSVVKTPGELFQAVTDFGTGTSRGMRLFLRFSRTDGALRFAPPPRATLFRQSDSVTSTDASNRPDRRGFSGSARDTVGSTR